MLPSAAPFLGSETQNHSNPSRRRPNGCPYSSQVAGVRRADSTVFRTIRLVSLSFLIPSTLSHSVFCKNDDQQPEKNLCKRGPGTLTALVALRPHCPFVGRFRCPAGPASSTPSTMTPASTMETTSTRHA